MDSEVEAAMEMGLLLDETGSSLHQVYKTWGFPSQFIQINQGVNGHTTRAPPGVPHTRASLEPGTSGFSTLRINHYATRGGAELKLKIKDAYQKAVNSEKYIQELKLEVAQLIHVQ